MRHLENLAVALLAIFAPIHSVMVTAAVLITADLLTGMWAAHKRKESITSAALRRTVSKIIAYELAILLGFLAETYMLDGSVPVVKLVAGMIGLTEIKSIMENLGSISGSNILQAAIDKLGSDNNEKK